MKTKRKEEKQEKEKHVKKSHKLLAKKGANKNLKSSHHRQ